MTPEVCHRSRLILLLVSSMIVFPAGAVFSNVDTERVVDYQDIFILKGPTLSKSTPVDVNSDGKYDAVDVFLLALSWQGFAAGYTVSSLGVPSASPTVTLDMDPSTVPIEAQLTLSACDPGEDCTFEVHLVVIGAASMTGVSVDLAFDPYILELLDIREVPGDLNFSGDLQEVEEVQAIRAQYEAEQAGLATFADFVDGFGRQSGVVYDSNRNQITDLAEVLAVEREYRAEQTGTATYYWTRAVFDQTPSVFNESVEIFDPPSRSNLGGEHPGLIDDMTAVLLKRPGRDAPYGFNGDAIVCTLTFRLKAGAPAGTYAFSFPQGAWIDNTFQGEDDIGFLSLPDEWPRLIVLEGSGPVATQTPTATMTTGPKPTATPYPIPATGDTNRDGLENVNDLFMFSTQWLLSSTEENINPFLFKGSDLIGDKVINQEDLYWLIHFLKKERK